MRKISLLASMMALAVSAADAAPLRFQVSGGISESSGEWSALAGETVVVQITGDLDGDNGSFEMVDNGEEPLFPRYTFSGGDYGVTISGAFGEFTTSEVSFEPFNDIDADAEGNPFGLTGIVDGVTIYAASTFTEPFFGGEIIVNLFADSSWITSDTELPSTFNFDGILSSVVGQFEKQMGSDIVAEAVVIFEEGVFINGSASGCANPAATEIGTTVNGSLSRINDCFIEGANALSDISILTLDAQSAFSLTLTGDDFPLVSLVRNNSTFVLVNLAGDPEETGSVNREFVLGPEEYRMLVTSSGSVPPNAGDFTRTLEAVAEPQVGCMNPTAVTTGVIINASLSADDCMDDSEGRVTEGLHVDGYSIFLPAGVTAYATLEAQFDSAFIWERNDADDAIETGISAGQASTFTLTSDINQLHTLVIATEDNASLGTYTLTVSDTEPTSGGSGGSGGSGDDDDEEPGSDLISIVPEDTVLPDVSGETSRDESGTFNSTEARITIGASADGGLNFSDSFSVGTGVDLVGNIEPALDDIGKDAEIFVVIRTDTAEGTTWEMLDEDGVFQTWNTMVPSLVPAYIRTPLTNSEWVSIFNGELEAGDYRVYVGYMTTDGPLVFNGTASRLSAE